MRVVIACATDRGRQFVRQMARLLPEAKLVVITFREEPWEPPFLENIRAEAEACGAEFHESRKLDAAVLADALAKPFDLLFAVSWRYLIPASIYSRAERGAYVFHDSMLPEYRGFAPTVWSIVNGEDHTGVTLLELGKRVDAGAIIDQQRVGIEDTETIADVLPRVTTAYSDLLSKNIRALCDGMVSRRPQDESRATYACRRLPDDAAIDWARPARSIFNLIRGLTAPYPGAFTTLGGKKLIIWTAQLEAQPSKYVGVIPGRIVETRPGAGSIVLCGDGISLLIERVQVEGEPIVSADQVLNKISITLGR